MKKAVFGAFALSLAFMGGPALANCHFGFDAVTGMETIICDTGDGYTSWGTMVATA